MDTETKKKLKRNAPMIINIVVCTGIYIAALLTYVIKYTVPTSIAMNPDINIWNEIGTLYTVLPILCPFIANFLIAKIDSSYPKPFRYIWSGIFALLIIAYRMAYILDTNIIILSVFGVTHFFVCIVCALVLDKMHSHDLHLPKNILNDIFGENIRNRNILSVQIFDCEKSFPTVGTISFQIVSKGAIISNKSDDVNSILKLNLEFSAEDYNQFLLSIAAYNVLVDNGVDEEGKKTFQKGIQKKKSDLVKRLNSVPLDDLSKSDSCLARILVCYNILEKMVDEPSQVTVDFEDGELGLTNDHEKRLFSTLRTGMLGAILFGSDRRYYFQYRRDGIKTGRKYCAFVINTDDSGGNQTDMHICLVTIRENSTKQISADIIDWIAGAEKKIIKAYSKASKEET